MPRIDSRESWRTRRDLFCSSSLSHISDDYLGHSSILILQKLQLSAPVTARRYLSLENSVIVIVAEHNVIALQAPCQFSIMPTTHTRALFCSSLLTYSRPPPRLQTVVPYHTSHTQVRTIFDLPGAILGNPPLRRLTQTKLLQHDSKTIFNTISDISSYPSFVPFAVSSTVKSKDSQGYPKSASLKVGYSKFGIEEDWDSNVHCYPAKGTIEAKSSDLASNGLFEMLKTKWEVSSIIPVGSPEAASKGSQTSVKLDIEVKFRNAVYDQMFSQVEGKVASAMIAAFEQRVNELDKKS